MSVLDIIPLTFRRSSIRLITDSLTLCPETKGVDKAIHQEGRSCVFPCTSLFYSPDSLSPYPPLRLHDARDRSADIYLCTGTILHEAIPFR